MCYLWSEFGVGKIIWGLIILVCLCPSHFLSIKLSKGDNLLFVADRWLFRAFEKVGPIIWGLRKLLEISNPVPNIKEFLLGCQTRSPTDRNHVNSC